MARRRSVVVAVTVAVVAAILGWLVAGHPGVGRGGGASAGKVQPKVPPGWQARRVGSAAVAVPDGWSATRDGVGGATVAAWSPGPPSAGELPTRCAIQQRPQWLLTLSGAHGDWSTALRRDLNLIKSLTAQSLSSVVVSDVHAQQVRGAAAALAFTSRISNGKPGQTLETADLLAALSDGTEVHVFCAGPLGQLPDRLTDGVDSTTLK